MQEYREHTEVIEIPKGTGAKGFLRAIEEILKLDRVQGISIDARGQVTYTRYILEDDDNLDIGPRMHFETLMPYAVVRNGIVDEVTTFPQDSPAVVAAHMFNAACKIRLTPVAFVTGADTTLFDWMRGSGLEVVSKEELFGLPILRDRLVADYVLLLAAAYGRGASFNDTQHSFKVVMPQRETKRENNALTVSQGHSSRGNLATGDARSVPALGVPSGAVNGSGARKPGGGGAGG